MPLAFLAIQNLRCFKSAQVELSPTINLIVGPNGSGKTTLLEAIDILSRASSFRTRNKKKLIRSGAEAMHVSGHLIPSDQREQTAKHIIKVSKSLSAPTQVTINDQPQKNIVPAAKLLPMRCFHPESHAMIHGSGYFRRRYIDWGVFHVKPSFVEDWSHYQKSLLQRNALLKQKATQDQIDAWNEPLAMYGERINAVRSEYVDALQPLLAKAHEREAAETEANGTRKTLTCAYSQGWASTQTLGESLKANITHDRARGTTTSGPHRADLMIQWNEVDAKHTVSRGQQKRIALLLTIAQIELFLNTKKEECLILIDDLASELDTPNIHWAMKELKRLGQPVIITSLSPQIDLSGWENSHIIEAETL